MDLLVKLFDMFNAAAAVLAKYIPQDKEDVLVLLKHFWGFLGGVNIWLGNVLGIDIQKIINIVAEFFVKYFIIAFNFLIELIKRLAERA